ncbi:hypothetical protein NDU88_008275 [Pleurodeles waltl]|uniref:Uncharacterized protein n=1 Tax=Pleurodeles waltl TaxID=8319 RepID=A0AAV7RVC2_PLEWA|nr:hypothetical protein NDU88_008275 [Pleurodeles waltl]
MTPRTKVVSASEAVTARLLGVSHAVSSAPRPCRSAVTPRVSVPYPSNRRWVVAWHKVLEPVAAPPRGHFKSWGEELRAQKQGHGQCSVFQTSSVKDEFPFSGIIRAAPEKRNSYSCSKISCLFWLLKMDKICCTLVGYCV